MRTSKARALIEEGGNTGNEAEGRQFVQTAFPSSLLLILPHNECLLSRKSWLFYLDTLEHTEPDYLLASFHCNQQCFISKGFA